MKILLLTSQNVAEFRLVLRWWIKNETGFVDATAVDDVDGSDVLVTNRFKNCFDSNVSSDRSK